MAVELAAAIKAVGAIGTLVQASSDAASNIRSGLGARNNGARQQLEARLEELGRGLGQVGELARAAEAYSRTHEQITALLQACRRVEDFLQDNRSELSKSSHAAYQADWRLVDALFESVKQNQAVPRSVLLDRADWYDAEDRHKIELRLTDFSGAFRDASKSVQQRFGRDAEGELARMITPLEDVELLLRTTLYDKILLSLERIG